MKLETTSRGNVRTNVTLRRIRVYLFVVEMQQVINMLCVFVALVI